MMARWLHALHQFQFSIAHKAGRDHGNADGLSRVPSSPCGQCTRPDWPLVDMVMESVDQPFDSESTGSSEDSDLIPIHWVALLDDDLPLPYKNKTPSASHSYRGLHRVIFHHGLMSKD